MPPYPHARHAQNSEKGLGTDETVESSCSVEPNGFQKRSYLYLQYFEPQSAAGFQATSRLLTFKLFTDFTS